MKMSGSTELPVHGYQETVTVVTLVLEKYAFSLGSSRGFRCEGIFANLEGNAIDLT